VAEVTTMIEIESEQKTNKICIDTEFYCVTYQTLLIIKKLMITNNKKINDNS